MDDVSIEDLQTPGIVFQIGVEPNRIDVLTSVEGLEFLDAWEHKEASSYGEVPIPILGLDDLIACKRLAGRPQDLLDVSWLEKAKKTRG